MKNTLILLLIVAAVSGGIYLSGYLAGSDSMRDKYSLLEARVEAMNQVAADQIARLRVERDIKQAEIERFTAEQEKLDVEAKIEIARLAGELERRPVRVRVQPARECGSGAEGDAAAGAGAGEEDTGQASGVLPKENTRRLREALSEIETLSAAYNSCKASLINLSGY